jgi:hypothetical protein
MRISPTACHESGHGCVSIALGQPVVTLTLSPPCCRYAEHTDAWRHGRVDAPPPALSDAGRWRVATIRALAGPVAEARLTGESVRACLARNASDRATAVALVMLGLAPADRNGVLRGLLGDARALVEQHWSEIVIVARALDVHGALYGFEVEYIIRRAQVAA